MKRRFELYPFFLFLLPAFVTIHLEKELHQVIEYRFVYDRIIIFFVVPLLLFFLFFLINRSAKKAALIAFTLSIWFFYTGEIKNWMFHNHQNSLWGSYSFLLISILAFSTLVIYRTYKSKSEFRNHFLIINTGLLLFIAADIMSIAFNKSNYQLAPETGINDTPCTNCEKPDIYYIIFDTYTSTPILESHFNYQNDFIEEDLRSKGFLIIPGSRSNYTFTAFSIGSSLNMSYIKNVDTINKTFDREYLESLRLVYKNRLFTFIEKEGYTIFNHSLFNIKSHPSTINAYDNWSFRELFDQYNLFLKMKKDLSYHLPRRVNKILGKNKYLINDPDNRRKYDSIVQHNLNESLKINTGNPKFIYAHFLKPHPPYSTDSLGNIFSTTRPGDEEAYIHQIAFSNRMIKNITDSIFAYSKRPLAIIIQGDHGFPVEIPGEQYKMLNNFNAIYFSNKNYSSISDTLTNVNTFRIVLNKYFKKNLDLLSGEFYIHKY
jgi:hypothetical protein